MANEYIKGLDIVLQIKGTDETDFFKPIGCLTENSISESSEMLDTTTRDNTGGWSTSTPTKQSYSISFTGVLVSDTSASVEPSTYASFNRITTLKRDRTRIEWKIEINDIIQSGYGYITEISNSAPVKEFVTFDGVITGYGSITKVLNPLYDTTNYVIDDYTNYIFGL